MELLVKRFEELTKKELYEILQLRSSVFVVEQNCVYQDIDGQDEEEGIHVFLKEEDELVAYLRILMPEGRIGRVIAVKRGIGLGEGIMKAGMEYMIKEMGCTEILISAQVYAKSFYEKLGFEISSEEYPEDGIPHIDMKYRITIQ